MYKAENQGEKKTAGATALINYHNVILANEVRPESLDCHAELGSASLGKIPKQVRDDKNT